MNWYTYNLFTKYTEQTIQIRNVEDLTQRKSKHTSNIKLLLQPYIPLVKTMAQMPHKRQKKRCERPNSYENQLIRKFSCQFLYC